MAACSTRHTTNQLAANRNHTKKSTSQLIKIVEEYFGEKSQIWPLAEKKGGERARGVGRRTREEIDKWNQMTALRFQTGGRHQTYPASSGAHRILC